MITLTSDFGIKDPYVAEMKGAILSINPNAKIIDVSHEVTKFNIRMAAFFLASAAPYFPKRTVHLAVVDPGVGTERRAIIVQTTQGFFVGPDNGVLMLAAQAQGIKHIYEITNPKFILPCLSSTFHGRDIFAPVSAHLDKGVEPAEFGLKVKDVIVQKFVNIKRKNNLLHSEVLHVDSFGNVITNIKKTDLFQTTLLTVNLHNVSLEVPMTETYGQVKHSDALALIGSHGFLEFGLNQGSFSEKYRVNNGDRLDVILPKT
jgi:S-adenosylmethionine hydrolase